MEEEGDIKRCECGKEPYIDRIAIIPTPWWVACDCGITGISDTNKKTAISNWNNDKLTHNKTDNMKEEKTTTVPPVRVRHYNSQTDEVEDGSVIEVRVNTYIVIPDYHLGITAVWEKLNCDVLR